MTIKRIDVDLGARSYPIHIGQGMLTHAAQYIEPCLTGKRIAIITDQTVAGLHLDTLMSSLADTDLIIETIILPPGEATKSFEVLQNVLAQLLAANFSRSDTLIAFGGGVIGDLTGFAASILKRGCDFIQIPTTLLAQVDSSVGGKTAINTSAGKNLVGCFYQPKMVLADIDVLSTLPARQMKAGYAEVLKYGLINDLPFFEWLETEGENVLAQQPAALAQAIATSCAAKAAIVQEDEREHGVRALLNLGHTFAHALEGCAGYDGSVLHGEAVSAGMLMAFELSLRQGHCGGRDVQRLTAHLAVLDMPVFSALPKSVTTDAKALFDFMQRDKKNTDDAMNLILARGIGQAFTAKDADQSALKAFLDEQAG